MYRSKKLADKVLGRTFLLDPGLKQPVQEQHTESQGGDSVVVYTDIYCLSVVPSSFVTFALDLHLLMGANVDTSWLGQ